MSAKKTLEDFVPSYVPDHPVSVLTCEFTPLEASRGAWFGYEITATNGDKIRLMMNRHVTYCEQFDLEANFKPEKIIGKRLICVDYADMVISQNADSDSDDRTDCLTVRIVVEHEGQQEHYFVQGWAQANYDGNDRHMTVEWPGHYNHYKFDV